MVPGDLVMLSSGKGVIYAATSAPSTIIGVMVGYTTTAAGAIGALAADTDMPVILASEMVLFECQSTTSASVANVGTAYDIKGTTGVQYVDVGSTSYPAFMILGILPENDNATASAYVRVYGRILSNFAKSPAT
jgi:hypothetical protein